MDELSEKLAGLLNDPDTMARVRQMAEGLLGKEEKKQPSPPSFEFMPSAEELGKIMSVMSKLNTNGSDPRSQLLLALKPHLSAPRQEKVDTALRLLSFIDILPALYELGGGMLPHPNAAE